MDRAIKIIKEFLREYAEVPPAVGDIEMETVLDDARGHYELRMQGWNKWKRVHGSVVHVDVRDGKIYVQHDGTDEGIAIRLTTAGIPADHIVLCFHHPDERAQTPFAVA